MVLVKLEDVKMRNFFLTLSIATSLILITGCPGSIDSIIDKELGDGYIFHEVAGIPIISKNNPYKEIPEVVVSYNYNKYFIIAVQKELVMSLDVRLKLSSLQYYDTVVNNGITRYWIIIKKTDEILGPLNKEEYSRWLKQLKIPTDMKLKE